ncbi:copper-binding protein [Accumulibacter sp.]|uniref:copper-binding protein n=1 Tax=Accumulibacter sp. TaxID=2053492 RepID=UPI0025DD8D47|nr:copper-binding protein [Accumulibacter sp.]MCM8596436.1 copper-binding protein [Accumulibacter sp.]MCM8626298.1 copper-binding protein [Accumulibacter sp.]MDS4050585.1 copper-binding protein [Accumulibacter sp.]
MNRMIVTLLLGCVALLAATPLLATSDHSAQRGSAATGSLVDGEVRKVDKAAGKVTIAHGPLPNLNMPAMTMAFRVSNAAWLEQLKAGDRIRFAAEDVNGVLTVVRWQPSPR